ncbi:MAG: YkoF family thiamine/hydroxymethylpyrimidine-binding protein [Spirochaetales bacterium]
MIISVELSFYPLVEDFESAITNFITHLIDTPHLSVSSGPMSTLLQGEFTVVFDTLKKELAAAFTQYPAVFTIKIANACPITSQDSPGLVSL